MPTGPLRAVLLGDPTTATGVTTGTSTPIDCSGYSKLTVYYQSLLTTSGGTLILEEAEYSQQPLQEPAYTGTWSQIESRAASSFTGGVQLAFHTQISAYAWVRVRISSDITGGGSVIVTLRGHQ